MGEDKQSIVFVNKHYSDILDGQVPVFDKEKQLFVLGSSGGTDISKVLFVDAINGDDDTAEKGNLSKTYKTCSNAKLDAISGDLIIVFPGSYIDSDLLKDGINWNFLEGTTVSPLVSTNPIFTDATQIGSVTCSIIGRGKFISTGVQSSNACTLTLTKNGSKIYLEAKEISSITNWNNTCNIEIFNTEITFQFCPQSGGIYKIRNCFFNNSINIVASSHTYNLKVSFESCSFYRNGIPVGYVDSAYDNDGVLVYTFDTSTTGGTMTIQIMNSKIISENTFGITERPGGSTNKLIIHNTLIYCIDLTKAPLKKFNATELKHYLTMNFYNLAIDTTNLITNELSGGISVQANLLII